MNQVLLAASIFLITYAVIISERVHRTTAALLGGSLMILSGVVSQEEAFHAVDLNVIFLLAGMMMIAYLIGETGLFQWLAALAVRLGRGRPVPIMVILAIITALASALLDNVTVVVLIAPVSVFVALNLGVSPVPFLITGVMASNIGGAATLIGDPPNILIGSAAGIDFFTFLTNMGPPVLISMLCFLPLMAWLFRKDLPDSPAGARSPLRLPMDELITDRRLLIQTGIVLGLVLLGFLLHGALHLEPATIALGGAALLLLVTRRDPQEILEHVEWSTLLFFVGLFISVEALVSVGIIRWIASLLLDFSHANLGGATIFMLWFSALASGIIDNIPYTAAMIPLIQSLEESISTQPLWWALALGADFGGNLTIVAASANLVVANIAARGGYRLSFGLFLRYGVVTVLVTMVIASVYVWIRYL